MHGRLRIHFSAEDLARLQVTSGPDLMWETVLSMHLLQTRRGSPLFHDWRDGCRRRLEPSARRLLALNPAFGTFPDFLTPAAGRTDLETGIDAMLSTPRTRMRAELRALPVPAAARSWVSAVADAGRETLRELGSLFRTYHRAAVVPAWDAVVTAVTAERQRLAQAFLHGGPEAVLADIGGPGAWQPPVLRLDYPVERDLHLDGRGLMLIPAHFCWHDPVVLADPTLPPVLVYPARRPPQRPDSSPGDGALCALLGFTRATVLRALESPCNTTALALRAGTSITAASQHASVLRRAGLVTTTRRNGAAVHSLTTVGAALLHTQATGGPMKNGSAGV